MRRASSVLLLAAGLGLAAFPAVALAPACPAAQADAWRAWNEGGGVSTRALAEAVRAAADACDAVEPPSADDAETATRATTTADRTIARECGITQVETAGVPDAPIKGVVQLLFATLVERDHGPSYAAYAPGNDVMAYAAVGQGNWSFVAANSFVGTITWHGVPFQATYMTGLAQAKTGCGVPPAPELCWGWGHVTAPLPGMGAIHADGEFYDC